MENLVNPELKLAFDYVQYTSQNIFLTGKAGTGKTTFLHRLKEQSPKRMVVVAPTGVAAINAGGVTIHSFFQMSFGPQIPHDPDNPRSVAVTDERSVAAGIKRFNKEKINIMRSLDLLVIDEISMVRADVLDGIDEVLRRFKNRYKPFGGVQLLMIGDLQQLSPIVKDDEWEILKTYYDTCYFFSSKALQRSRFVGIELKHIYRQNDQVFINLLNKIRENKVDDETLAELNKRHLPGFKPADTEGYITLTTHNYQSQEINQTKLAELKSKVHVFHATIEGEFQEYQYPTDPELSLKVGAQVMFVKNDIAREKRYFNGKIGTITNIDGQTVTVECPDDAYPIVVERVEWQNVKFVLNQQTQEIDEEITGTFTQVPLKLAWAITIHKSQGLTFEKAIIDARLSFAHGQVYVALSRCKTLDGLVLRSAVLPDSVKSDATVIRFTDEVERNQPGQKQLQEHRFLFQRQLLIELFDFKPVLRQIQYLLKLHEEHSSSLMGNLKTKLTDMISPLQNELIEVAGKFGHQVDQLMQQNALVEENQPLQERIQKAGVYFIEKFQTIVIKTLSEITIETDNKAVRKTLAEALAKFQNEAEMKKACLSEVQSGFQLKKYLEVRAKSAIEPEWKGTASRTTDATFSKHPAFYQRLKAWRTEKANMFDVEIARVLRQTTLMDIADQLPATPIELKAIAGMGGKKMQQFGKEILTMVIAYRREKGMDVPLGAEKEVEKAGLGTKQLSYELFQSGMSVAEVARERQLAESTIETHLLWFVAAGKLNLERLVEPKKVKAITEFIEREKSFQSSEIRAALGDDYSYSEIRFVMRYLESAKYRAF